MVRRSKTLDENKPLTVPEKDFVHRLIKGEPQKQAYRAAGYKANDTNIYSQIQKVLNKPNVIKYRAELEDMLRSHIHGDLIATREETLIFATRVLRGAESEESVHQQSYSGSGSDPVIVKTAAKIRDRLKAASILIDHYEGDHRNSKPTVQIVLDRSTMFKQRED